ncbi:DUF5655 domain-containing protein [Lactiplantibacillus plantarum]|uniref:DUF5655 domain-containing protein n=1 Tax=Lactiplantibacillus plantarum TaxID=1590 RepID=UPI000B3E546D|nr:DUF5655 domain-containing protein [Lactiplantibacillus plantarum]ARW34072.1 uncharacterized protein S102022_00054 [Lactiplantibacillus plantarum]
MDLYKINQSKNSLNKVRVSSFNTERELQDLIENNLELVLGIQFIVSEFTVGHYRLDTVAYDSEVRAFVIIEYKRTSKDSVVDQGTAYLNTLLQHKADFTLAYNEKLGARARVADFDWTQTRVVFIAGSYTNYQKDAIDNPNLPIELYEARKTENGYLTLLQIMNNSENSRFANKVSALSSQSKVISKAADVDQVSDLKPYTEEMFLDKATANICDLYDELKAAILLWDSEFEVKPTKVYIGLRIKHHNVVDLLPQKSQLKIWINLSKGELNDPNNLLRDVSSIGHWGNGDYEVIIKDDTQIEYILSLIKQAWEKYRH